MTGVVNGSQWDRTDWALWYAGMGYHVFPLKEFGKVPHAHLGETPVDGTFKGGLYMATTDYDQIVQWWSIWPRANIGVRTGRASGLLVLDLDTKNGGDPLTELWDWCQAEDVDLPEAPCAETVTGGMHVWLALPETAWVPTRRWWLPDVDVKADGGYVVVPPSEVLVPMPDRQSKEVAQIPVEYRWLNNLGPLPEAPDDLLAGLAHSTGWINQRPPAGGCTGDRGSGDMPSTEWFVQHGLGAWSGSRDSDCIALARRLWNEHGDERAVVAVVYRAWERRQVKDHDFTWEDAYVRISRARNYWHNDLASLRSLVGRL